MPSSLKKSSQPPERKRKHSTRRARPKPSSSPSRDSKVTIAMHERHIPEGEVVIDDPQVLEVLYEPTRHRIFRLLTKAPLAVRDLAEALETTANRLYHHVRLLEKHGLIRVTDGRVVGNKIERLYAPAAQEFRFAGELSEIALLHSRVAQNESVREVMEEIALAQSSLGEGKDNQVLQVFARGKLSKKKAQDLSDQVNRLIDEFFSGSSSEDATEDDPVYGTYHFLLPLPDSILEAS